MNLAYNYLIDTLSLFSLKKRIFVFCYTKRKLLIIRKRLGLFLIDVFASIAMRGMMVNRLCLVFVWSVHFAK